MVFNISVNRESKNERQFDVIENLAERIKAFLNIIIILSQNLLKEIMAV